MSTERHVRLFRNGRNQAARISRELNADEVIMHKEDDTLIIVPIKNNGLLSLLGTLSPINEELPDIDESFRPIDDVNL